MNHDRIYTINGDTCHIELFNDGWGWTIKIGDTPPRYESNDTLYASHNEALQGAMDYVRMRDRDIVDEEDDFDDESRKAYIAATGWSNA